MGWIGRSGIIAGLGAGLLGVAACLCGAARAETEHVTLALPVEGLNFLGYYVAEDLGIFKQEQIEVKAPVIAGVGSFNAVVAGSVEFSFSSGSSLTRAAAHGQRLLAIAQMNNLPVWDIVVRKDIAEAAHFDPEAPLAVRAQILKGRTMAIAGVNALDHAYLRIVTKAGGTDPDAMTIAPMAPPDALAAFARKAVDGFVAGPPWVQRVEDDGSGVAVAIGPNGEPGSLVPIASSLLMVRPQTCVEHRSLCVKMGHSMALASKAVHERTKDVLAALTKRFNKIDERVMARALNALVKAMPLVPKVDPVALRKSDEINVEAGFLKSGDLLASYDGLSTDEFLK
jgi:ABC-type nitrate/sulfonate/bicarbonate transport system substrate-binding protein